VARQGFALRGLGQLHDSATCLETAMALAQSVPDFQTSVDIGGELGHCYLRQGKMEQVLTIYGECQRLSAEHNLMQSPVLTRFRNGLVEVYLAAAEQSSSVARSDWLKKAELACTDALRQGHAYRPGLPETLMLRGRYEWLRGNPVAAREWWQRSLALAEELNERFDLAATHLEMGLRLGDRSHLGGAVAILAEIGAGWDLARARAALVHLG
jgi:tetratricopeptide (TPR) repeat protein